MISTKLRRRLFTNFPSRWAAKWKTCLKIRPIEKLLERFAWWDKPIDEINALIPLLTSGDLEKVRKEIKMKLKNEESE